MSSNKAADPDTTDRSDWKHAWDVVSQLAAVRGATLRDAAQPAAAPRDLAPVAPDQLARDIAEIEKAAAALRAQEPNLEPGHPDAKMAIGTGRSGSIWILLATIWISAALVVSGALGALALLFG